MREKTPVGAKFGRDAFFDVSAVFGAPFARLIVQRIIRSKVTPIHLTLASLVFGIITALLIAFFPHSLALRAAAFFTYHLKNIFDTCDGTLARARGEPDRLGRLLDSVVDYLTGALVFAAMTYVEFSRGADAWVFLFAFIAFHASTLSTSFYVYYTVSFQKTMRLETVSRVDETPGEEDSRMYDDPRTQRAYEVTYVLFLFFYHWQDRLAASIDRALTRSISRGKVRQGYYTDRKLLTLTSLVGLGVHIFIGSLAILSGLYYLYFEFTLVYSLGLMLLISAARFFKYRRA